MSTDNHQQPEHDPVSTSGGKSGSKKKRVRRVSGSWVFVAMIAVVIAITWKPAIDTIDCTPEIVASKPDVIMLGAWWCGYCNKAKHYFHDNQISYCEYDMERDATGIRLYQENGGGAIPVMIIGDYILRGYSEGQIDEAVALLKREGE